MADEKKLGVYICSGCDIGDCIDVDKLKEDVSGESQVALCKTNKWLCNQKGVDEIRQDVAAEGLDGVVIAACSPRYLTDVFDFGEEFVHDRVNLREQVAWTHEPMDKYTYDMALDYVKMGIAKVENCELPEPKILDNNDSVMVVGGGVTGMSAARSCSKAGYNVVLIEKEAELGGFYGKLHKLTPSRDPYYELEPTLCDELIAEVRSDPRIKVLTGCEIEKTDGQPGMYDVTAKLNGDTVDFQVASIIQATGWKQYDARKIKHLHYGDYKNVITNIEMEKLAKEGNIVRPSDGKAPESVVFVQCAGSRDKDHLPYCSSVCCMTSLKQAIYIREKYPDTRVYIIYKDIRTPGQYEMFYKRVQNEDNIFLTKGEISGMEEASDGSIKVMVDETLLDDNIDINADMVVLATGMVPSTAVAENGQLILDKKPIVDDEEKKDDDVPEAVEADPLELPHADILSLTYRQGPDLPLLKYGFPDSHYVCFPYETRRTGIYAAGTVRQPMDSSTSKNDADGAALKAIQIIESINRGTAVHPRAGDQSFPDFFLQRCTQCKRCTEECPFGTLDEDIKGTPKPNPNRCRRCGICMGACPERIISFKNYSVRMISQMIKAIYVPTEEEDEEATPRILVFMCENDAYPSLDIAARKRIKFSPNVRIIPVRCLGSVNISWIADSLSAGIDGVMLFGCVYGDDYQCHFIKGSELANRRMENVQEKLKQLVLEPERVELHMLSIDEYDKVPALINTFAETIDEVGPNPYKEM